MKVKCFHSECKMNSKYGNYCFKHRNLYLLDENSNILINKFTNKIEDYYKKDLKQFYVKNIGNGISLSKVELFEKVKEYIYLHKIIMIQSYYRGKCVRISVKYEEKCNNEEDFYTYEKLENIPKKYFYTYTDSKNIKWGFDIRSLKKLIDMKYDNPYTTEKIPDKIIKDVSDKINILMKGDYNDLDDLIHQDKKTMIKHRIIDACSIIERNGFTCMIEWIEILTRRRVKDLYRVFEDTINYRAQLSDEVKIRINPPSGIFFNTPLIDVLNMDRDDILILILNEIDKFTKCNSDSDRKLGYMYFIISLSAVSHSCHEAHSNWINFIN